MSNIKIGGNYNEAPKKVYVILYCPTEFNYLSENNDIWDNDYTEDDEECDEIVHLARMCNKCKVHSQKQECGDFPLLKWLKIIMTPLIFLFKETAVSHHLKDWCDCIRNEKLKK